MWFYHIGWSFLKNKTTNIQILFQIKYEKWPEYIKVMYWYENHNGRWVKNKFSFILFSIFLEGKLFQMSNSRYLSSCPFLLSDCVSSEPVYGGYTESVGRACDWMRRLSVWWEQNWVNPAWFGPWVWNWHRAVCASCSKDGTGWSGIIQPFSGHFGELNTCLYFSFLPLSFQLTFQGSMLITYVKS